MNIRRFSDVLGVLLVVCTFVRASDDPTDAQLGDPTKLMKDQPKVAFDWWTANGVNILVPFYDNAKNQLFTYKMPGYLANTNLLAGRAEDNAKNLYVRTYAVNSIWAPAFNDKVDAFWDRIFQKTGTKDGTGALVKDAKGNVFNLTTRAASNPSYMTNCHTYALATFVGKGTWKYFMPAKSAQGLVVKDAYDKNTTNIDITKNDDQANDVCFYASATADHSSGIAKVVSASSGVPRTRTLQWKWGQSSVYSYSTTDYHTPMFADPTFAKDTGPGQGDLNPNNSVRRP